MKTLFIGFGHVGQKIAEIITEKKKYPGLNSLNLSVTGIYTKTRGVLTDPSGIDIPNALRQFRQEGHFNNNVPQQSDQSLEQIIQKGDYDLLLELSTLSITNKGEPAISYIREALKRGKHVVTANKGPVAFAYNELSDIARKNNVHFRFESTVMDGTPVFNLAEYALKGATITRLSGILNSTTNYILSRMEQGKDFCEALEHAQKEGFAEADSQHDIDGWDSAAKIATLANVLMQANITPFDVDRMGISVITPESIIQTVQSGKRIKLICQARIENGQVIASVKPSEIPESDTFATIVGSGACLRIETDLMNPILIVHDSPAVKDTAFGVLQDIYTIQQSIR